jgi:sulfotransferase 6B1
MRIVNLKTVRKCIPIIYLIAIMAIGACHSAQALQLALRILTTSIPKTGTFLINKCVSLIRNKKAILITNPLEASMLKNSRTNFLLGHIPVTDNNKKIVKENKYRGILIYRDPRDQLVSLVFWIHLHPHVWPEFQKVDFDTLLFKLITDCSDVYVKFIPQQPCHTIADVYNLFLPWMEDPHFYTTTFEKLVGPRGGGGRALQLKEIKNIAQHLEINLSTLSTINIAARLFGNSATFRAGKIGSWKDHFKPEHIKAFKEQAPDLLTKLGYDDNW